MKTLFKRKSKKLPKLTIILLDWAVRESFHALDYLNRQNIDREDYEILWIEFYDYRAQALDKLIAKNQKIGVPPPIDNWIILGHDRSQCYHKHVMYNTGILNAVAPFIAIMDSDCVVKANFVQTILDEFRNQPRQVLHLEQIRNFDQKHYPFDYPTIEEMTFGSACVNATKGIPNGFNGSPRSLKKEPNLWHVYNYGACFIARREDLIRIGGADEHQDYLGHICGPYELTARLINAGVPDRLHPSHWTYHTWHPNTGGDNNYCGPNDGKGMSTTAMQIPHTGRIFPLVENSEIKKTRLKLEARDAVTV
jgi:hypothetical protein